MRSLTLLGYLFLVRIGACVAVDSQVFEELYSAPDGWEAVGEPSRDSQLSFRIALQAADPTALERSLYEVSSPSHPNYGQHLTAEQAKQLLSPTEEGRNNVIGWLESSGIKDVQHNDEWIHFKATTEQANSLMDTKFLVYRHVDEASENAIRTTKVVLPRKVHPYVKMIHPTTRFGLMKPQRSVIHKVVQDIKADGDCISSVTPQCLKDLYKIPSGEYQFDREKTGILGVAGFLTQYARFADLTRFLRLQAPWATGSNFTYSTFNGKFLTSAEGELDQAFQGPATEANLDIQYTVSLSHPMKNHFYSTGGLGPLVPDLDQPAIYANQNEPYLEFFQALEKDHTLPHTISFSYGENEQSVPASYAKTICDKIGQLGTRGVSIIFSSGDTGPGSACQTNDGKNKTRFMPVFPAACPYVTAVGGTNGVNPEKAVSFSSGGFSEIWPRPKYQEQAVKGFLGIQGEKFAEYYNKEGRGFPDIAAQSQNFTIVEKSRLSGISGTSAAAPVIAAIVGLLNAKRIDAGQPTLGFLNPWLYESGPQFLTDITTGKSRGCTGIDQFSGLKAPKINNAGWSAVKGWDPVTGLGTPLFPKMVEQLPRAASKN